MFRIGVIVGLLLGVCSYSAGAPTPKAKKSRVEVVFCLDTTGSMGGLISAAKVKIWAICNQIASGKPTPELKVGLVAYRDKKDKYVTQIFNLTEDLDAVHTTLQKYNANGGGDGPESVNLALHDAVNKINWSRDTKTLKILFLVGDAPPHMDYKEVKYPETCQAAVKKGIIINTIQCGNNSQCRKHWQEICRKAEGSYVQIAQSGGVVAVATPFDKRLAEINTKLARSTLAYGSKAMRKAGESKAKEAASLPAPAAAERASFAGKSGRVAAYDLLDDIKRGKVKLEKLKEKELPKVLQNKSLKEQKGYLDKLEKERTALQKEAVELDKKRSEYIRKELAKKKKGKDGFDQQVVDILRKQAKKFNIKY